MPIWSLTQERVEKLLKQIGDKEIEIDTLIKLTVQDIWKRDLDDFINEWRFQLEDEAKRQKKVANMGRRASNKLRIGASGPTGRKRKAKDEDSDDSDFGGAAPARKAAPAKKVPKTNLLSDLKPVAEPSKSKTTAKPSKAAPKAVSKKADTQLKSEPKDVWMNVDGESESVAMAPIFKKAKPAAPVKPAPPLDSPKDGDEDSADEENILQLASRPIISAATKPVAYNLDDSDDSNGDGVIFDVGKMVKGIGNASEASTSTARPLFSASMSRPGSSAGLPKKTNGLTRHNTDLDAEMDDTDYAMLAPPPTDKKAITARETVISDDSMDDDADPFIELPSKKAAPIKKAPAAATKKTAPAAPKPAPKKAAAPAAKKIGKTLAEPKKLPLSPDAKAYAAKQQKARAQQVVLEDSDEDEVEKVANELLDDEDEDDEPVVGQRRPARRAAVAAVGKTRNAWGSDDDDGDGVSEDDDESEVFEDEGSSFE